MSEFTKGPWEVVDGFDEDGNGVYFPHVLMKKEDGEDCEVRVIINMSHDQEPKSIMANAHLIASAPAMYEALEGLHYLLEWLSDNKCECDADTGMIPCEACHHEALVTKILALARGEGEVG